MTSMRMLFTIYSTIRAMERGLQPLRDETELLAQANWLQSLVHRLEVYTNTRAIPIVLFMRVLHTLVYNECAHGVL
jgi:hypothetical protein